MKTLLKKYWLPVLLLTLLISPRPLALAQSVPAAELEDTCGASTVQQRNYVDSNGANVTISVMAGDNGQTHDNWWYSIVGVDLNGTVAEHVWDGYVEPARAMHSFLAKDGVVYLLVFQVPTEEGTYEKVRCMTVQVGVKQGQSDFSQLEYMLKQTIADLPAPQAATQIYMPIGAR